MKDINPSKYRFFYDSILADMVDASDLPDETMNRVNVNVKRDDFVISLSLTEDEAVALMKEIAKKLNPKKVYKAIGNIVVKG